MNIVTDLKRIKEIAEQKNKENWEFRSFLKMYNHNVDKLVQKFYKEIQSKIDCRECANCCKTMDIIFESKKDIAAFAKALGLTAPEFKEKYLIADIDEGESSYKFKVKPCSFLENNHCINYENRPEACRSYPHLHKKDFVIRLMGVIGNCSICPIVFNVFENLKAELWHKRRAP